MVRGAAESDDDPLRGCSLNISNLAETVNRLDLLEKIGVVFLTFDPEAALDECRGVFSREDRSVSEEALRNWASSRGRLWPPTLIEAMLIVRANRDVAALVRDFDRAETHFLPDVRDVSRFVHPMKKTLFKVCEELTSGPTAELLAEATANGPPADRRDAAHLEIYLLKLVQAKKIALGSWKNADGDPVDGDGDEECDADFLKRLLKPKHYSDLYDWVAGTETRLNSANVEPLPPPPDPARDVPATRPAAADEYSIVDPERVGHFLIFDHKNFRPSERDLAARHGTEEDVRTLTECWTAFGFRVTVFRDLDHDEIAPKIRRFAENEVEKSHGAFAVAVLSHGTRGKIFGSDSKPVDVEVIKASMRSRPLIGKPKMLLIQACRGDRTARAAAVQEEEPPRFLNARTQHDGPSVREIIPDTADFLIFWSTVDSYVSFRDIREGSWFIQELCKKMMEEGEHHHLMDVFTAVNDSVSKKMFQISQLETTFRKKLRLKKIS